MRHTPMVSGVGGGGLQAPNVSALCTCAQRSRWWWWWGRVLGVCRLSGRERRVIFRASASRPSTNFAQRIYLCMYIPPPICAPKKPKKKTKKKPHNSCAVPKVAPARLLCSIDTYLCNPTWRPAAPVDRPRSQSRPRPPARARVHTYIHAYIHIYVMQIAASPTERSMYVCMCTYDRVL